MNSAGAVRHPDLVTEVADLPLASSSLDCSHQLLQLTAKAKGFRVEPGTRVIMTISQTDV